MAEVIKIIDKALDPGAIAEFIGHYAVGEEKALARFSAAAVLGADRARLDTLEESVGDLQAGQSTSTIVVGTKATLLLITSGVQAHGKAEVYSDATVAFRGVYENQGSAVTSNWVKISDLAVSTLDDRLDKVEDLAPELTIGGTANALTASGATAVSAYRDGALYSFRPTAENTDFATINVDSLGAIPILERDGIVIERGRLRIGEDTLARYDLATNSARLVSPARQYATRSRLSVRKSFLAQGPITNPATRYAETSPTQTGGVLTQTYAGQMITGRVFPYQILSGDTLVVEGTLSGSSFAAATSGIVIGANATMPVADYTNLDGTFAIWRGDGGIYSTDEDVVLIEQPSPGITIPPVATGNKVRMEIYVPNHGVGFEMALYLNDAWIGTQTFLTSNLFGGYFFAGAFGTGTQAIFTLNHACARNGKRGLSKKSYVNPSLSPGGDGSAAFEYSSFSEMIAWSSAVGDEELYIKLNGGNLRDALILPNSRYRKVTIEGATDSVSTILGSEAYTAAGWTKTPGLTNVYQRATSYVGTSGGSIGQYGLWETTAGQTYATGISGSGRTVPYIPHTRMVATTSLETLDLTANRLSYIVGTGAASGGTNAAAGLTYIHARASLNPNTLNYERAVRDFCFAVLANDITGGMPCEVVLRNITMKYAGSDNIRLQRVRVVAECVYSDASGAGRGWGLDDTTGRLVECTGRGNGADGFNGSPLGLAISASTPNGRPTLILDHCRGIDNIGVGDGASHHNGLNWEIIGGEYSGNGKDGISCADNVSVKGGTICDHNVGGGLVLSGTAAKTYTMKASNFRSRFNNIGVSAVAAASGSVTVDLSDGLIESNVSDGLLVFALAGGTGTIRAEDMRTAGTLPSSGAHRRLSGAGGTETMTVVTPAALS